MHTPAGPSLAATYFDGKSAKAHAVELRLCDNMLHITCEAMERSVKVGDVQWPERTRHGKRIAHLPGGGLVQTDEAQAWDAWQAAHGRHDSLVVTMQQSWRTVLASVALLLALLCAAYVWGLPRLADAAVVATPLAVDARLGETALAALDRGPLQPSQLGADEQKRIQAAWQQAVGTLAVGEAPQWSLVFRKSTIGPNAFALPGGTMVMTDEMVKLVDGDSQVLNAVLAHELGHVQHRDGLRMLVHVTVLGSVSSALLGDFSSVLAAAPILLGQAQYSRQAEHQADVYSVHLLKAAHIPPAVMVTLFEKLAQHQHKDKHEADEDASATLLGIAFASHPTDSERIAFFRQAAP